MPKLQDLVFLVFTVDPVKDVITEVRVEYRCAGKPDWREERDEVAHENTGKDLCAAQTRNHKSDELESHGQNHPVEEVFLQKKDPSLELSSVFKQKVSEPVEVTHDDVGRGM